MKPLIAYKHIVEYGGEVEDYKIIEKSLKALEIIKEKKVDIHLMFYYKDLEVYNSRVPNPYMKLTQEEYKLLKEALL